MRKENGFPVRRSYENPARADLVRAPHLPAAQAKENMLTVFERQQLIDALLLRRAANRLNTQSGLYKAVREEVEKDIDALALVIEGFVGRDPGDEAP